MEADTLGRWLAAVAALALGCSSRDPPAGEDSDTSADDPPFALGAPGFVIDPVRPSDIMNGKAGGDVNGDGLADVIVETARGPAYIVFGKADAARIELAELAEGEGIAIDATDEALAGGRAVLPAGDINGDGLDDLLIYAGGYASPPALYVVFGAPALDSVDLSNLAPGRGRRLHTADPWHRSWVRAIGDVNGDGFADAAVIGGICCRFEVRVVYGSAEPIEVTQADLEAGVGGLILGGSYGTDVHAAGDVNGDGFDDLAVEFADNYNRGGATVYVVFGGPDLAGFDFAEPAGLDGFAIKQPEASWFAVDAGRDVNGDGLDDVVVATDYGAELSVIFGKADAATVMLPDDLAAGAGFAIALADPGAHPGGSATPRLLPDLDGDGLAEVALIVGAGPNEGGPPAERVQVIYGRAGPGSVTADDPARFLLNDWPAGAHLGEFGGWAEIDGAPGLDLVVSFHGTSSAIGDPSAVLVYFDPPTE